MASNVLPTSFASLAGFAGRLFLIHGRLIRLIPKSCVSQVQAFLNSRTAREFTESDRFVPTRVLDHASRKEPDFGKSFSSLLDGEEAGMALEHESLPFPTFAHEWPSEMLHAAGQLTLELAEALLLEGLHLEAATPHNVLFRGPEAVFVDPLSIDQSDPRDPVWLAEAQFVRTFLLPLLAYQKFGLPTHQVFLARSDVLELGEFYRSRNSRHSRWPTPLKLSSIPPWLRSAARASEGSPNHGRGTKGRTQAQFLPKGLLKRLSRTLERLMPPSRKSPRWSDYMLLQRSYTPEDLAAKESFVRDALTRFQPKRVLDVGCNTGHFSILAARGGATVVALDSDSPVVGQLWRRARAEKLDILPLVVNFSRPTPAINGFPSFLDRTRGSFDAVLLLAVIHHMQVTEGVPLSEILARAAELTTDICVAEFVGPADPFFQSLLDDCNERAYEWLNTQAFEDVCRRHFKILASRRLGDSHRWLYLLKKKAR